MTYETPEANRRLGDREVAWLEHLKSMGLVERSFNWLFFTAGDSREPELAGIRGALFGSALTLFVTLILCLPIGVAAAIYLEEFAPKNRVTELIEVNINNLAAVPSIVFGLLGLAVFLNFFGLPRSAPLVGGSGARPAGAADDHHRLACRVESRSAFHQGGRPRCRRVRTAGDFPPRPAVGHARYHDRNDHRDGARARRDRTSADDRHGRIHRRGADQHHRRGHVLPVQIFLWSDLPEIAFQSKTAAAIIVLLLFLFVMNGAAIVLRRRFERRW